MRGIKKDSQMFKSLRERAHAEDVAKGILILKSVNYYRLHSDSNEFTIIRKTGMSSLANEALLFCCHRNQPKDKPHLVRINRPCELFMEIKAKLSKALLSNGDFFGEVRYENMNPENPGDFDVRQINFYNEVYKNPALEDVIDNNYGIECAYYKNKEKYSHEDEVRMCFLVCPERLLTLRDDDITKIAFYRRTLRGMQWEDDPIDYNTWKNDEKTAQNRDNYWFEVRLKVQASNFMLIKTQ